MSIICLGIGIIIGLLINPIKEKTPILVKKMKDTFTKEDTVSFVGPSNLEDIKNSKTLKDFLK